MLHVILQCCRDGFQDELPGDFTAFLFFFSQPVRRNGVYVELGVQNGGQLGVG